MWLEVKGRVINVHSRKITFVLKILLYPGIMGDIPEVREMTRLHDCVYIQQKGYSEDTPPPIYTDPL